MSEMISSREAQERFSDLMQRIKLGNEPFVITEDDTPAAVLLSMGQYRALLREMGSLDEATRQQRINELFGMIERLHALDLPPMTEAEIEAEIQATRAEKRAASADRR